MDGSVGVIYNAHLIDEKLSRINSGSIDSILSGVSTLFIIQMVKNPVMKITGIRINNFINWRSTTKIITNTITVVSRGRGLVCTN